MNKLGLITGKSEFDHLPFLELLWKEIQNKAFPSHRVKSHPHPQDVSFINLCVSLLLRGERK